MTTPAAPLAPSVAAPAAAPGKEERPSGDAGRPPAVHGTAPNLPLSLGAGVAATAGFFAFVHVAGPRGWYVVEILLARGVIPYLIVLAFSLGVAILWLKRPTIARERTALRDLDELPSNADGLIDVAAARRAIVRFEGMGPRRATMVVARLEAACRKLVNSGSSAEVDQTLGAMSGMHERIVGATYAPVRYIIWLIPSLGFIGTVVGIGRAIAGFGGILQPGAEAAGEDLTASLKPVLAEVVYQLGIAFDTTLLALALSIPVGLVMAYMRRADEALLHEIDDFCLQRLVTRLRVVDATADQIILGFARALQDVNAAIDTSTYALGRIGKQLEETTSRAATARDLGEVRVLLGQILDVLERSSAVEPLGRSGGDA